VSLAQGRNTSTWS